MWKIGMSIGATVLGLVLLAWGGGLFDGEGPGPVNADAVTAAPEGPVGQALEDEPVLNVEAVGGTGERVDLDAGPSVNEPSAASGEAAAPKGGVALRGYVVDPNGKPVPGATVYEGALSQVAMAERFPANERRPFAETNEEGRFVLMLESTDAVILCAHAENFADSEELHVESPGTDASEELLLTMRIGATVTGIVYDKEQVPIEGRSVAISSSELGEYQKATTDKDGRYELRMMNPGSWRAATYPSDQELTDAGQTTEPASVMAQLKQAEFTLLDGETTEVHLGLVSVDAPRITGTLRHMGEPIGGLMQWYPAARPTEKMISRAGKDGAFEVDLPTPGNWIVHVNAMGADSRGQRVGFDFEAGERREIAIDLRGATVAGVVHGPGGDPLGDVEVELRAVEGAPHLPFPTQGGGRVQTDKNGAYRFELLVPGSYVVVAHGSSPDSEDLAYAASRTEPLQVSKEDTLQAPPIFLTEGASFDVSVSDAAGRPVSGASLFFHDADGFCLNPTTGTRSRSASRTTSPVFPLGPISVTAIHMKGTSEAKVVMVGTDKDVSLVLGAAHWVELDRATDWVDETSSHVSIADDAGREWTRLFDLHRLFDARPKRDNPPGPMFGPLPAGRYHVRVDDPSGTVLHGDVVLGGGDGELTAVRLK